MKHAFEMALCSVAAKIIMQKEQTRQVYGRNCDLECVLMSNEYCAEYPISVFKNEV